MKKLAKFSRMYGLALAVVVAMLVARSAFASVNDSTFSSVYTTLHDWATGSLGQVIAIGSFITGMAIGLVRQSLMAIALGVGCALAMNYGPDVLGSMFTAMF